jgi:hypothetical protein
MNDDRNNPAPPERGRDRRDGIDLGRDVPGPKQAPERNVTTAKGFWLSLWYYITGRYNEV